MSGQRYRVTGKPNIPHDALADRVVGDEFDADLDKDEERLLIDIGALAKVPKKAAASSKKAESKAEESKTEAKASDQEEKADG